MISQFFSKHFNEILELSIVFITVLVLFKAIDIFNANAKKRILAKRQDSTILGFMPLINKVLKFTILFLALATILQSHGYSITSLIAGFGITGLAVGFGAQSTISNVFGSFSLLADKAYKIGDYIVINQTVHDKAVEGIVEDINLRSTKIRTTDGLIIVPNNIVANGVVKNTSIKEKVIPNEN
ncbi:MAG TPA: mechanosensitive ion channel [Candidatus Gastranaerophilaceae bacterium]|nr:mechanosensitive ion channel [Candidatus Gastranaerophilaceae bacterium]HPT41400.1 mechanosensitive ion channel [Candidatus Gastranaerophilaceae bacterium]